MEEAATILQKEVETPMRKLLVMVTAAALMWQSSAYALTTLWDTSGGISGLGIASNDLSGDQGKYSLVALDDFVVGAPGWVVKKVTVYGLDLSNRLPNSHLAWVLKVYDNPDLSVATEIASVRVENPVFAVGIPNLVDLKFGTGSTALFTLAPGTYWLSAWVELDAEGLNFDPTDPNSEWGKWWYWRAANLSNPVGSGAYQYAINYPDGPFGPYTADLAFTIQGDVIPEPTTLALFGLGLAAVAVRLRRQ